MCKVKGAGRLTATGLRTRIISREKKKKNTCLLLNLKLKFPVKNYKIFKEKNKLAAST